MEIKLSVLTPNTNIKKEFASLKLGCDIVLSHPDILPSPPQKPFCLLSITNIIELYTTGELISDDTYMQKGQRFLTRTVIRLSVGWECIEIFPFLKLEYWKPEYASTWAENDILASVVAQQSRETQFQSLDPKLVARRQFAGLLQNYKDLLDSNPEREEILQSFLRDNPSLLCPTYTRFWPKLPLGTRVTDFVFREANNDYLLVELERSTHRLFLKSGHPSSELNHACDQIVDWKRYIEDNPDTVQRELGLSGISASPNSLVVIGRSQSLTPENRRRLVTMQNVSPKLKIMTYDDVYDNAKAVIQNLLGIIWDTPEHTRLYYLP